MHNNAMTTRAIAHKKMLWLVPLLPVVRLPLQIAIPANCNALNLCE
jgi:hypothetical protein